MSQGRRSPVKIALFVVMLAGLLLFVAWRRKRSGDTV